MRLPPTRRIRRTLTEPQRRALIQAHLVLRIDARNEARRGHQGTARQAAAWARDLLIAFTVPAPRRSPAAARTTR